MQEMLVLYSVVCNNDPTEAKGATDKQIGIDEMNENSSPKFTLNISLHNRMTAVLNAAGFEYASGLVYVSGTRGKLDQFDDSHEGEYSSGYYRHIGSFNGTLSDHFSDPSEITTRSALKLVGILK